MNDWFELTCLVFSEVQMLRISNFYYNNHFSYFSRPADLNLGLIIYFKKLRRIWQPAIITKTADTEKSKDSKVDKTSFLQKVNVIESNEVVNHATAYIPR